MATTVPLVAPLGVGQAAAPVGQGFELNASDLRFILKQIKIAEHHVANTNATTGPCGALIGPDENQIPEGGVGVTLPWGLRTVDGSCNNIVEGQSQFGTADENFPRMAPPVFRPGYAPSGPNVPPIVDSEPRMISNLIVDQSVRSRTSYGGTAPDNVAAPSIAPARGLSSFWPTRSPARGAGCS